MRRMIVLLIGATLIFSLFGCSKHPTEPSLTLSNGYTHTTILMRYKIDGSEKKYEGVMGNNYVKIKQGSKLQYKFFNKKDADKSTLLIQKADTKEKVKEVVLDNKYVETSIPQGKYIYNFLIEWENGSARFRKLIEIE